MSEHLGPGLTPVGRVVQNAARPLTLSADRSRFSAYIFEDHKRRVHEGMILIAQEPEDGIKVICRVCRLQSYGDQSAIAFQSIHEFVTVAELEPLGQLRGTSTFPMVNENLNGFSLRPGSVPEISAAFRIPLTGVSIGEMVLDGGAEGIDFRLPDELIYRSAFFCGAKGSGKTSSILSLLPKLSSLPAGRRPALVVLDVEGEFGRAGVAESFVQAGVPVARVVLSTDPDSATSTLGLGQVHYEDFAYFAPNLPLNSMIHLESITKELWHEYAQSGRMPRAHEILNRIQQMAWRRPAIHTSQREALIRATTSDVFGLFDQADLPSLKARDLVMDGQVTILDVSRLTDDQQRVAALFLLSSITRYKDKSQDNTGVLIVMDEAQKLFPHKGDLKPEYAERLGKFVGHIVHRGRRRRLGIVLATQYPADVSREVADLCDTKLVFRMSGSQTWIRAALSDTQAARRVPELGIGEAYATSTGLDLLAPVRVRFPAPLATGGASAVAFAAGSSTGSCTPDTASVPG